MADDFEQDLAQLRSEIARFVLEAIAADPNGQVAKAMGRGLQDAVTAALAQQNLSAAVGRAVADGFDRSLPTLTDAASRAAVATDGASADPFHGLRPEPRPDSWAWAKSPSFIVGVLALFVAVMTLVLVFTTPGLRTRPADRGQIVQTQDDGATPTIDAETGWQRVLDQVQTWPQPERRAALDALCGQSVNRNACPTFDARRYLVSDARQRAAAAAAMARAMGELGYCAPPAEAAANTATNATTEAAPAAPDALWDCLVYGAARG